MGPVDVPPQDEGSSGPAHGRKTGALRRPLVAAARVHTRARGPRPRLTDRGSLVANPRASAGSPSCCAVSWSIFASRAVERLPSDRRGLLLLGSNGVDQ